MAEILIEKLQLSVIVGTKHCERNEPQNILIDLSFIYDSDLAQKSDDLADAIDYEALTSNIKSKIEQTQFFLIEKLADYILNIVMNENRIKKATVVVYKPTAISSAQSISIKMSHKR